MTKQNWTVIFRFLFMQARLLDFQSVTQSKNWCYMKFQSHSTKTGLAFQHWWAMSLVLICWIEIDFTSFYLPMPFNKFIQIFKSFSTCFTSISVSVSENPRSLQNITWVGLHWFQYNQDMRPGGLLMFSKETAKAIVSFWLELHCSLSLHEMFMWYLFLL